MKIILCGYHWAGCKALEILSFQGHELFVYTHESSYNIPSLKDYCIKLNIPHSLEKISTENMPFTPDLICSIYYRDIISENIITLCNHKILNLHPSLLPQYRGCSSLTWAMINHESYCGYTYHYVTKKVDAGNIIYQQKIQIEKFDTQETLYYRVMFYALENLLKVIDLVQSGYQGELQIGEPTYYPRGCPYNGEIDSSWEDEKVERFIRAMTFPPYPLAKYKGVTISTYEEYKTLCIEEQRKNGGE